MNAKITFPELINLLSAKSGQQKKVCEAFLKEFFAGIAGALVTGETVKIRNFGTFKLTDIDSRKSVNVNTGREIEIPGHRRITFTPAKSLAEKINEPFEAFESVELADEVTDELLNSFNNDDFTFADDNSPVATDEQEESVNEPTAAPQQPESVSTPSSEPTPFEFVADPVSSDASSYNFEDEEDTVPYTTEDNAAAPIETHPVSDTGGEPQVAPVKTEPSAPSTYTEETKTSVNNASQVTEQVSKGAEKGDAPVMTKRKPRQFGFGFVAGILTCLVIGVVGTAGWYYYTGRHNDNLLAQADTTGRKDSTGADTVVATADTAVEMRTEEDTILPVNGGEKIDEPDEKTIAKDEADTKPSDSPVYDKITKTRYLTTMAKDHYGSYHFWPYIYNANPGLGDPDRIRPGTKIKIPSLASIGANPKNAADIKAAKALGTKIYKKYGK